MDNLSETTSRFGGTLGAALLAAVLFALVLGVYGAVYIDAFRPLAPHPAPVVEAVIPTPAVTPVSEKPMIPPPSLLEQINPSAGRNTPAPIEAIKPGHQADAGYWVEFAAYRGTFYAAKLVERLTGVGVRSNIVQSHGLGGHLYYSVRTGTLTQRTDAATMADLASRLGLSPLIHRGVRPAPMQKIIVKADMPVAHVTERGGYWVQFGAYNVHRYAQALRDRLRHNGLVVTIIERQRAGYARYLVRSAASIPGQEARRIAARGQAILRSPPLIGRAPLPAA